jgi:hypothetical protein
LEEPLALAVSLFQGFLWERFALFSIRTAHGLHPFGKDVAFVQAVGVIVSVDETIFLVAGQRGLLLLVGFDLVMFDFVGGCFSFLGVSTNAKILCLFHSFAELDDFDKRLGIRIKVLLLHFARPRAWYSMEDNISELVTCQDLVGTKQRACIALAC